MAMQLSESTEPREVRIPVPWGFIAAKSWGKRDGYPIIAVHGTMDNAASFDGLAPLIPNKFHFLAIDLPGCGRSSHYPDGLPYHFVEMVSAIRRVVRYYEWETCHYVGHSFGGMLGSFFAAMYPETVKKLVMIDIVQIRVSPIAFHSMAFRANYERLFAVESKTSGNQRPTYTKDELLKRMIASRTTRIGDRSAAALMSRCINNDSGEPGGYYLSIDQKGKASVHVPLSSELMCAVMQSIRCELLMVRASESRGTFQLNGTPELVEVFRKCCSRFESVTVEGYHDVHMDHPERVAPIVSKFLLGNSSL
ncbi:serine hydrolase-like protein isoform X2 [Ischnura elegans]|uniref:serine hydrolase-like protein isoform X2 n=1 Tax=Ischnura elegans TaxID=197161 RepID=UPI001ED881D7|nr:serine hydrolase-like protein isoform X2 [Ischnura elegans]